GRPVLAAIRCERNHSIAGGELLDHIATAPTSGFFSKTARYYDADLFAIDIKRIGRWYNQKGFYEAKVENVEELRDDKGRVTLLVKINEGRRAVVRKMEFTGAEAVPHDELSDVDDALPIHPGDGFDEDLYEKAKDVLLERLREHGFARAKVRGRVEVAPEEGSANIVFDVESGARFKFGVVTVSGNQRVASHALDVVTGFHRGDGYTTQS